MSTVVARYRRNRKGQALIETIVGLFILVPIALAGLDLATLVVANQANDSLAKGAARAAANMADQGKAQTAAQNMINKFPTSTIIPTVSESANGFQYGSEVTVQTRMVVRVPAPFPGIPQEHTFVAHAVEPVVGAKLSVD